MLRKLSLDMSPVLLCQRRERQRHQTALSSPHVIPIAVHKGLGVHHKGHALGITTRFIPKQTLLQITNVGFALFVLSPKLIKNQSASCVRALITGKRMPSSFG